MTFRARILALALIGAAGVTLVASAGVLGLSRTSARSLRQAASQSLGRAQSAIERDFEVVRGGVTEALLAAHARDASGRDRALAVLREAEARLRARFDSVAAASPEGSLSAHYRIVFPEVERYLAVGTAIAERASADSTGAVAAMSELPEFERQQRGVAAGVGKGWSVIDDEIRALNDASASEVAVAKSAIFGAAMLVVILSLLVGFALQRRLAGRLRDVSDRTLQLNGSCLRELRLASAGMAAGDLSLVVTPRTQLLDAGAPDEIGALCRSVNDLLTQTHATIASFEEGRATLRRVIEATNRVAAEATEGRLTERVDETAFAGSYRELVHGVNGTLESFVAPLRETGKALDRLAMQDLTTRVEGRFKGDHARVARALDAAVEQLAGALEEVSETATGVAASASQIEAGSRTLAHGASDQAGSLEQVSASARELAAMTRQNAASAAEGRSLSEAARTSTKDGVTEVQRLADAIDRIKASSEATAKIIRTIDEIAFQTNLLALNAAVEAARAGESGRGFAVVAEEVRNLAMRSAEAARNTAALIDESVKSTELGVEINSDVLKRLSEIDERVNRVGQVVAEIAVASDEQAKGVELIDRSLEEMSQRTQAVAATAEESEAASRALAEQSSRLRTLVSEFRLDAGTSQRSAPPDFREQRTPGPDSGRPSRTGAAKRTPAKTVARVASGDKRQTGGAAASTIGMARGTAGRTGSSAVTRSSAAKLPPTAPTAAVRPAASRAVEGQAEISIPLDDDDWNTIQSF